MVMRDVKEGTSNAAAAAPKLEYQVAAAIAAVTFAAIMYKAPSASVTLVPPPRPAGLTAQATATSEDGRVRLLGLSLPGFVPSRETIAKTVVSWSGSIAGVISGL